MRWVRKDRRVYDFARCTLCGTGWGSYPDHKCPPTTCPVCGTTQCMANGLGHGTCGVCLVGLLPGWSGNSRTCERARCKEKAVARVGNKAVCAKHLKQKDWDYIALCLERRATEWEEVAD